MSYLVSLPSAMPTARCVPSNNMLSGPLGPVLRDLAGAFGDLLLPTAILMIIVLALMVLATVMTKRSAGFMKAIGVVALVLLGIQLLILIVVAIHAMIANGCSVSVF